MKRAKLFHPKIFSDRKWAEGYFNYNAKNIERAGKRFSGLLKKAGFEGGRVFDVGCGFGVVAIELAKSFPHVQITGIDLGDSILKIARSLTEEADLSDRITFMKGDVHKLEFEADTFDLVVNTFMVHIVDDPIAMLNEIDRVTRPDGKIMITDLRRCWLGYFAKELKKAFTFPEGLTVIKGSQIRPGKGSKGSFWWDYMVGVQAKGPDLDIG